MNEATASSYLEKWRTAELRFADQLEATKALRVKLQEAERKLELLLPVVDAVEKWIDGDFEDYTALSKLSLAFRNMETEL